MDCCSSILPNTADREDAVQAALIKVFERAADFDPRREALPWAVAIALYECRTVRRSRQRRKEDPPPDERIPDGEMGPEGSLMRAELEAALRDLRAELRPEDAVAIAAAIGEIERPNDVKKATMRKRIERALGRLRTAWRTKHGVE
jgi:RNA polymerase sigma-70 factor (ECF subfamily)